MPTVPRYESQVSADVRGQPGLQVSATPEAFGGGVAQGLEALGVGAQALSNIFEEHALKLQAEDNETEKAAIVTKGLLAYNARLYDGDNAYYGKTEKGAVDDFPVVKTDLVKIKEDAVGSASNPAVAKLVENELRQPLIFNLQGVSSHYLSERKRYEKSTFDGNTTALAQQYALNYADKDMTMSTADQARKAFADWGIKHDMPPEAVWQDYSKWLSAAEAQAIALQSFHDPIGAQARLDENRSIIEPDKQLALERSLQTPLDIVDIDQLKESVKAGTVLSGGGAFVAPFVNGYAAAKDISKNIPGTVVTGVGPAQSAAAKAARVPGTYHDLPGSQAVDITNPNMSLDQLAQAVKKQYGPAVKVLVEGPGAKNSTGPHVHVQWEKQQIAPGNATPLNVKQNGQEFVNNTYEAAKRAWPGDPEKWEKARQSAQRDVAQQVQMQTLVEAQSTEYIAGVMNNYTEAGQAPSYLQYMKDPQFAAAWNALPETKQSVLLKRIETQNKQGVPATPEQIDHYHQLWGMQYTAPQELLKIDPMKEDLTPKQQYQIADIQARIAGKKAKPMSVTLKSAINDPIVKAGLKVAGMTPSDDPEAWNKFLGKFQEEIDDFTAIYGQPPKPENLQAIARNLMLPAETGFLADHTPLYNTDRKDLLVNGVPNEDARRLGALLRAKGRTPTPALIKFLYANEVHPNAR